MHWTKIDKKWNDRLTKDGEGDVTWKIEQWQVPGEAPLEVRACVRKDVPVSKFANTKEAPRTSIVLHLTCGYGNFSGLMGGSDHSASAHFILGRCGTPYLLVPTEFTSWHATWWNNNSVGIEIDNIGNLQKRGNNLVSAYGEGKDVYCSTDDKDVFLEKTTNGSKYWATMTEKQMRPACLPTWTRSVWLSIITGAGRVSPPAGGLGAAGLPALAVEPPASFAGAPPPPWPGFSPAGAGLAPAAGLSSLASAGSVATLPPAASFQLSSRLAGG